MFEFAQGKANYYGFELTATPSSARRSASTGAPSCRPMRSARRSSDFGPAPLIPPFRMLGALTGSRGQFDGRIEVERAFAHNRTAPLETDTPGYTMVNASIDWHPLAANPELTLSLQGNNLFDVEARRSTSQLKDYAPLAGRDIRLSARFSF